MNPGRIFAGLTFILSGTLLVLDRTGVAEAGDLAWDLWPLLIVALGVNLYFTDQTTRTGGLIIIGIGVFLLILNVDVLPGSTWDWLWPAVLIGIGIWIISRRFWDSAPGGGQTGDRVSSTAILSSSEIDNRSQSFNGGTLTTALGSIKLNLRHAGLAPDGARLDITTIMGDTEVRVPETWAVQVNATRALGDVNDDTGSRPYEAGDPVLTIQATSIMGDIKIKRVD